MNGCTHTTIHKSSVLDCGVVIPVTMPPQHALSLLPIVVMPPIPVSCRTLPPSHSFLPLDSLHPFWPHPRPYRSYEIGPSGPNKRAAVVPRSPTKDRPKSWPNDSLEVGLAAPRPRQLPPKVEHRRLLRPPLLLHHRRGPLLLLRRPRGPSPPHHPREGPPLLSTQCRPPPHGANGKKRTTNTIPLSNASQMSG